MDPDRALQLRDSNSVQHYAAVPHAIRIGAVVEGARATRIAVAASAAEEEWHACLEVEDSTNGPAPYDLIQNFVVAQVSSSVPEGQIECAVQVERVPDIEERRPVAQPRVAQGEGIGLALPVVRTGQTQCVTPGVVGVEL